MNPELELLSFKGLICKELDRDLVDSVLAGLLLTTGALLTFFVPCEIIS